MSVIKGRGFFVAIFACCLLLAGAFVLSVGGPGQATVAAAPPDPSPGSSQLANPASVNCVQKGGKLEIVKAPGGEVGICVFSDNSRCEEWAFLRGQCQPGQAIKPGEGLPNPASKACVDNGGQLEIVKAPDGETGVCVFPDGSRCDEWAFFRGECKAGDSLAAPGMSNPASQNCVDKGGTLSIVKGPYGEVGMCTFPDASTCEEWAFFRGECQPGWSEILNPATKACLYNGGKSEIVTGQDGEFIACVFPDGAQCEEWAFFRGECKSQVDGPERITFPTGATSTTIKSAIGPNEVKEYIAQAQKGQTMSVEIKSPKGDVRLTVYGVEDGSPLVRAASGATSWRGVLPMDQDYMIKAVAGPSKSEFEMLVSVK